jgi:excisionase family DNA binding protein
MDSHVDYYTTAQAAELLGVSEATIRRWVAQKRIRADVTVSGQFRFTPEYIDEARPRPVAVRPAAS